MLHYLLIFDHNDERLIDTREFSKDECVEATDAYQEAEARYRDDRNIEIVLIGADSLDTIKRTHGHYFGSRGAHNRYLSGV
jgi:hypothetical protein